MCSNVFESSVLFIGWPDPELAKFWPVQSKQNSFRLCVTQVCFVLTESTRKGMFLSLNWSKNAFDSVRPKHSMFRPTRLKQIYCRLYSNQAYYASTDSTQVFLSFYQFDQRKSVFECVFIQAFYDSANSKQPRNETTDKKKKNYTPNIYIKLFFFRNNLFFLVSSRI